MHHIEFERLPQAVGGIVAARIVSVGDACEQPRQHREFAGEQGTQNPALGLPQHRIEPGRGAADLPPDLVEGIEALCIDKHMRDGIHPFIAGGAVHAGKGMQLLLLAQDLLDHDIERLGCIPRFPDQPAQSLEILRGIAQAVDVIEPQAMQPVFRDQPPDQPV